ncbi:MAG: hypothetical protein EP343_22160 [Deltaproteobacteria bacterium]|nr:MAG: hypothetical protein EP343_22160 [Deltaproteobacteria bacterium]
MSSVLNRLLLVSLCLLAGCAYNLAIDGTTSTEPDASVLDPRRLPFPKGTTLPDVPKGPRDVAEACTTSDGQRVCVLEGTYTGTQYLTANTTWLLKGLVHVGEDRNLVEDPETPNQPGVLVIEPGATVQGDYQTQGALVIHRSSQIYALGTKERPIVFTSSRLPSQRKPGDWGGLFVSGQARISDCGSGTPTCQSVSPRGFYGGTNNDDNSGVLQYVRVEFAGRPPTDVSRDNGLVLQGVGRGTQLSHVHIHQSLQAGLTLLGGTASWKYVVVTGAKTSHLHWRFGWRGAGQFLIIEAEPGTNAMGIDGQNNPGLPNESPRSQPTLSNVTVLGPSDASNSRWGVALRYGTGANLANMVVQGWQDACVTLGQSETFAHAWNNDALSGSLTLSHSVLSCGAVTQEPELFDGESVPFSVKQFVETLNPGNRLDVPQLQTVGARWVPKPNANVLSGARFVGPHEASFFQRVSFVGAVGSEDWTASWVRR